MTHAQRWHAHRHTGGRGHLYQSRFKSFPIEADRHFLSVCRYVERNPLRARLVKRAERWRWGSLWLRGDNGSGPMTGKMADWPVTMPRDWVERVNQAQDDKELAALRTSSERGRPYGTDEWSARMARRLRIESSLRPVGRPKKKSTGTSRKVKKKGL
jgi:putative transposase